MTSYNLKIVFTSPIYGETKCHFKVPICEHLGISHLTWKKVKIDNKKLAVNQEHLLGCNYSPSFEDFSILVRKSKDFKLKIMEILQIARDQPVLNKVDTSLPSELLRYNISRYFDVLSHHVVSIYPIVQMKLLVVQISILCYKFCIFSKVEYMGIWYHFRRDHESSGFWKLAPYKRICGKND